MIKNKKKSTAIIYLFIFIYLTISSVNLASYDFSSILYEEHFVRNKTIYNLNSQTDLFSNLNNFKINFKKHSRQLTKAQFRSSSHEMQVKPHYTASNYGNNAQASGINQSYHSNTFYNEPIYRGNTNASKRKTLLASNSYIKNPFLNFPRIIPPNNKSELNEDELGDNLGLFQRSTPFSKNDLEDNYRSVGIGPGGDPTEPSIPIGDGYTTLILMSLAYIGWLSVKSTKK